MIENQIAEDILSSLLRYEQRVRDGQAGAETNDLDSGDELTLACAALRELETAMPRKPSDRPAWAPSSIGRFAIESVLGSGGFAVVYLAVDPVLGRQVALKVPRPHTILNPLLRRRFVAESQTVARLQHPHIVAVYEAGEEDDLPYMATAYCSGPTLSQWLRSRQSPAPGVLAARIVQSLAGAVQYSHDNSVLHRDIKPENVMLFPEDHSANADFPFCPRLGDFGLAKILDEGGDASLTSQMIGTPRYMASEVILGGGKVATAAADVYGLGALLYTLLTGQPPFSSANSVDILKRVCETDPLPPHVIDSSISKDLSLICLKCIEKSPTRRYASARDLAEDLERFQAGRPVTARATSLPARAFKWCRRHPLGTTTLVATAIFLLLAAVGLQQHFQTLNHALTQTEIARREAIQHQHLAEEHVFVTGLRLADSLRSVGDLQGATRIIDRYVDQQKSAGTIDPQKHFGWQYLNNRLKIQGQELAAMDQSIWKIQASPDADRLAICGSAGVVRVVDPQQNYETLLESQVAPTELNGLAWCDALPLLATSGDDGVVRICDSATLQVLRELAAFESNLVYDIAFLPGSTKLLVSGTTSVIQLWDVVTGELLQSFQTPHDEVETLKLSSDGRFMCTGGHEGKVCLWDLSTFELTWTQTFKIGPAPGLIRHVRFTDDGSFVVASAMKEFLIVFRTADGTRRGEWTGYTSIRGLDIKNQRVFAAEESGTLTEFRLVDDGERLEVVQQWIGHTEKVSALCVSRDRFGGEAGGDLVTADRSGRIVVWPERMLQTWSVSTSPLEREYPVGTPMCWKDHETLLRCQPDGFIEVNVRSGEHRVATEFKADKAVTACGFDSNHKHLIWGNGRGELVVCNEDGRQINVFSLSPGAAINNLSLDKAGSKVVVGTATNKVYLVDLPSGNVLAHADGVDSALITSDGKWVCLGTWLNPPYLQICDSETLAPVFTETRPEFGQEVAAITDDGRHYVSRCVDGSLRVWSCPDGEIVGQLSTGISRSHQLAIHPDCRTLVTLDDRSDRFTLWDLVTGSELLVGGKHSRNTRSVSFSPTGRFLVSVDNTGAIYVDDAITQRDARHIATAKHH